MRPTLGIALLVVALIGCLASQLLAGQPPISMKLFLSPIQTIPYERGGRPASCGNGRCGCRYLGLAPKEKRVKTNQREEIIADWRLFLE